MLNLVRLKVVYRKIPISIVYREGSDSARTFRVTHDVSMCTFRIDLELGCFGRLCPPNIIGTFLRHCTVEVRGHSTERFWRAVIYNRGSLEFLNDTTISQTWKSICTATIAQQASQQNLHNKICITMYELTQFQARSTKGRSQR